MNGVTLIVRSLWYCYNCGNRNDEDDDGGGADDEMMADGWRLIVICGPLFARQRRLEKIGDGGC